MQTEIHLVPPNNQGHAPWCLDICEGLDAHLLLVLLPCHIKEEAATKSGISSSKAKWPSWIQLAMSKGGMVPPRWMLFEKLTSSLSICAILRVGRSTSILGDNILVWGDKGISLTLSLGWIYKTVLLLIFYAIMCTSWFIPRNSINILFSTYLCAI